MPIFSFAHSEAESTRRVEFRCPYWDLLPPLSETDRAALTASILTHGINTPLIVIDGPYPDTFEVIDGYNRLSVADEQGGFFADAIPIRRLGALDKEQLLALAYSLNEDRRQLTEAQKATLREARRAKVAELRADGKSLRAIAKAVGVSKAQVANDLSDVSTGGHLPDVVKGADGKQYPSTKPPKLQIDTPAERSTKAAEAFEDKRQKCDQCGALRLPRWIVQIRGGRVCEECRLALACDGCGESVVGIANVEGRRLCVNCDPPLEASVDAAIKKAGALDPKTLLPLTPPDNQTKTPKEPSFQGWNTPEWLLTLIRKIAPIALDPCSNKHSVVGALIAWEEKEDGLNPVIPWAKISIDCKGLVYVNPPYSDPLPWARKAIEEAASGAEIVLCLPSSHSAEWWQLLDDNAQATLLITGKRVDFTREGKAVFGARHETTLFYFGPHVAKLAGIFGVKGDNGKTIAKILTGKPYVKATGATDKTTIEAWSIMNRFRKGKFMIEPFPLKFTLEPPVIEAWKNDPRIVVREEGWLEQGIALIKASVTREAGLAAYDALIDKTLTSETTARKKIQDTWQEKLQPKFVLS
jgi:hypothetical protein